MIIRSLYTLLWLLALPAVLLRLIWRAHKQPAYLRHLSERLGSYTHLRSHHPVIWIHAVSVGETRAAEPLIRAILHRWPDHHILLTHMTPTGRETAGALFASEARITQAYLPYDIPFFTHSFLKHFNPILGVIMETELWPNLISACHSRHIPLALANARLSARSAKRYARLPALTRLTLTHLTIIGAQTPADAARFTALGASNVQLTGNIKFDIAPPPSQRALGASFRTRLGNRPILLAASTREGEESQIIEAFRRQAPSDTNILLVIVPRHPQRFNEIARQIAEAGFTCQRRSDEKSVAPTTQIWLGDSMGEMFAYYHAADVALIGGGWAPLGGQNPIEACAVGTPAVVGPHMFNFEQITAQACTAKAILQAQDVENGIKTGLSLLENKALQEQMVQAGYHFIRMHQGATENTIQLIAALLTKTDT